jgi:hypothetical protein
VRRLAGLRRPRLAPRVNAVRRKWEADRDFEDTGGPARAVSAGARASDN